MTLHDRSQVDPEDLDWYYFKDGSRKGPITKADLERLIQTGALARHVFVWKAGLPDWVPAEQTEVRLLPPIHRKGLSAFLGDAAKVGGVIFVLWAFLAGYAAYLSSNSESARFSKSIPPKLEGSKRIMPLTNHSIDRYSQFLLEPYQNFARAQFDDDLTKPVQMTGVKEDPRFPTAGLDVVIIGKMGYDYNLSIREIARNEEVLSNRIIGNLFVEVGKRAFEDREQLQAAGMIDHETLNALLRAFGSQ